jgi:FKBP-type peptidyl-prolyl cis-trans isomerase FklB
MNTMKLTTLALAATFISAASAQDTNKFKTDVERYSYAIGVDTGTRMKQSELELNAEMFLKGLQEAHSGTATLLTDAELRETFTKLSAEIRAKQAEKQRKLAEKNKAEGDAFLAENKNKPGVISLPNGLQYKVITEGSGESPKPEDMITAHYRGTLIDGTEFDASKPDQPMTRAANQVIRGWTEALTRMKPGAKWQLFIPSDLAYMERGYPPKIGPNATLIFDIELVSFKASPPPTPPPIAQPLTSDIIKVPSLEEMKKGAKIETIKAEDVEKLQKAAQEEKKAGKPE